MLDLIQVIYQLYISYVDMFLQFHLVYNFMNFRKYISSLRSLLNSGQSSQFVLGNSGADYDSVIGSLLYAFYLTTSLKITYLPLIDCSEQDLNLRFQITTVLDKLNINSRQLIYTDMVKDIYSPNHSFALYDHNFRPQIKADKILQIIDHHAYDPSTIKCPHIITHCGSALTLLYYLYNPTLLKKLQHNPNYQKFEQYLGSSIGINIQDSFDSEVINQLFYSGIQIDTYGLNENQAQVWTQMDQHVIQDIEGKIKPFFDFDQLASTKFDAQKNLQLNLQQHRKKDYKCISYDDFVIHYSTILLDIDLFIDHYWEQIQQQIPIQKIGEAQIFAFMFAFPSAGKTDILAGNFKKYILFTGSNQSLVEKLQKIMEILGFQKLDNKGQWKKWTDPTGKTSRKIFDKELRSRL